jgi:putative nucleotidyltransferase with HDIG domain
MIEIELLHKKLKDNVNEKRYKHSINVAKYAEELAARFNINPDKAYIAGLLHDCAKQFDSNTMLEVAYEARIVVTEIEKE